MVCNCGMVLIRIRHAQNVIPSNQFPIKCGLRGYRESPTIYFLFPKKYEKHIDLPYCGKDILPFLGSFKMFNIMTDHTGTTALCVFHDRNHVKVTASLAELLVPAVVALEW